MYSNRTIKVLKENLYEKGGLCMDEKEKNVTKVSNEDKNFIRVLMSLSPEKKLIAQGILIGMNIQDKQEGAV